MLPSQSAPPGVNKGTAESEMLLSMAPALWLVVQVARVFPPTPLYLWRGPCMYCCVQWRWAPPLTQEPRPSGTCVCAAQGGWQLGTCLKVGGQGTSNQYGSTGDCTVVPHLHYPEGRSSHGPYLPMQSELAGCSDAVAMAHRADGCSHASGGASSCQWPPLRFIQRATPTCGSSV
jgi:hypothetical protein